MCQTPRLHDDRLFGPPGLALAHARGPWRGRDLRRRDRTDRGTVSDPKPHRRHPRPAGRPRNKPQPILRYTGARRRGLDHKVQGRRRTGPLAPAALAPLVLCHSGGCGLRTPDINERLGAWRAAPPTPPRSGASRPRRARPHRNVRRHQLRAAGPGTEFKIRCRRRWWGECVNPERIPPPTPLVQSLSSKSCGGRLGRACVKVNPVKLKV